MASSSRKYPVGQEVEIGPIHEVDAEDRDVGAERKVHPKNGLNELSAKEWIPETVSVWTQRGLGANHPDARIQNQLMSDLLKTAIPTMQARTMYAALTKAPLVMSAGSPRKASIAEI
jgi:hypothetical protein